MWPYDISKYKNRPSNQCFIEGKLHKALQVQNIEVNLNLMKNALDSNIPFVFGIQVYESFETNIVAQTGIIPTPNVLKEKLLGGHAMLCCGYDDDKKWFIVRNSWGIKWGDKGYCYIGYNYLTNNNLVSDLWAINKQA